MYIVGKKSDGSLMRDDNTKEHRLLKKGCAC